MASQDLGKTQTLILILPSCHLCVPVLYIADETIFKRKKKFLLHLKPLERSDSFFAQSKVRY